MCKITENMMLCTCEDEPPLPTIHHKKSKRWKNKQPEPNKTEYTWILSKYGAPPKYSKDMLSMANAIGRVKLPSKMLSEEITVELFLEELNKHYCFDFEYKLNEGDHLKVIKNEDHCTYFSFIYKKGIWEIGRYSPFGNKVLTTVNSGKVKF